jgi:hypothetical protein
MKVAVIGGGWYGCHIAAMLKSHDADVCIIEKNDALFSEASGHNQFRLHMGLHYARSAITRHQSRDGFFRFSERYPKFSRLIEKNIYVVPKSLSLIDFETYFSIMYSSGISVEKVPLSEVDFLKSEKICGALACLERLVITSAAKSHFELTLGKQVRFQTDIQRVELVNNKPMLLGETFDYVVDATWGALSDTMDAYYFEPTLLLYYRYLGKDTFPAITLVDGALWSLYPTETQSIYTLSSVTHTPVARVSSKSQAYQKLAAVDSNLIKQRRKLMEQEVQRFFPTFLDRFEYVAPQLSIKTKPIARTDDRSASILRKNRCFQVNSGKIDTIFFAADTILGTIFNE